MLLCIARVPCSQFFVSIARNDRCGEEKKLGLPHSRSESRVDSVAFVAVLLLVIGGALSHFGVFGWIATHWQTLLTLAVVGAFCALLVRLQYKLDDRPELVHHHRSTERN